MTTSFTGEPKGGEVFLFFLGGKKSENMAREKALTPEMVSKSK